MKTKKVKAIAIALFVVLVLTSFSSCNNEPEATTPAEEVTPAPTPTPTPAPKVVEVATEAELKEALKEGGNIKITASFDVTQPQEVGKDTVLEIPTGKTITYSSEGSVRLFTVKEDVSLTVKGKGKIDGTKETSRGLFTVYGKLTIEEGTFETVGNTTKTSLNYDGRGALIYADTTSDVIINGGSIYAKKFDAAILAKGKLTINDGTITSNSYNQSSKHTYAITSRKELIVNGGEISGVHGGIAVMAGTFTINGGKVSTHNRVDGTTIADSYTYYALYIAGESGGIEGTIKGGEFISCRKYALLVGNNTPGDGGARQKTTVTIEGGKFQGNDTYTYSIGYAGEKTETKDEVTTTYPAAELILKGGSFKKEVVYVQNSTNTTTLSAVIDSTAYEVKEVAGWYNVVPKATT